MGGIPWLTTAPDAYAKADRSRRQVDAISSLAGLGGRLLSSRTKVARGEQDDEATLAQLQAQLGEQQDRAVTQSQSPQEQLTGAAASTNPATGGTIREEPLGSAESGHAQAPTPPQPATPNPVPRTGESTQSGGDWKLGRDSWSDLDIPGTLAGAAGMGGKFLGQLAAGANLIVEPGRDARRLQIAKLRGQVARRGDDIRAANALRILAAHATDPGKVLQQGAPTMGFKAGDITLNPAAQRSTLVDQIVAAHPGDRQGAIDAIIKAQQDIRSAGRGTGPGGHAAQPTAYGLAWTAEHSPDPEERAAAKRALAAGSKATHRNSLSDLLGDERDASNLKPTPNPPAADTGGVPPSSGPAGPIPSRQAQASITPEPKTSKRVRVMSGRFLLTQ